MKSFGLFAGTLLAVAAFVLSAQVGSSQTTLQSGLYQIVSGNYAGWGFGTGRLPQADYTFIELKLDPGNRAAQMRLLGEDMQTALHTPPQPCRSVIDYVFTNGVMFGDIIRFYKPIAPSPDELWYSFTISNSLGTLSLNGELVAGCPGWNDIPTDFYQQNIVAVLIPVLTIRVSEAVDVCWSTVSNRTYQVQYSSSWTTNAWTDLGSPMAGSGTTNCIRDQLPFGSPQRFYRVLALP